ncbi:hypothetical protein Mevan_0111 [Methanococcus vannielii SB]|uniref:Uncharacterized protein n=1 Tax=Methanococcus vannielii (strain ATCC 35089 / DSM 1224 / JCM 13029 / OCM 148 / SB) TaxID=406327 RepID=A6UNF2_METVS|nr:CorA family divalent cation transporter [Methanococcus vannielii]ABR54024.1 hypothetical protein Mevan_0111 [Methanococcus vannielii SB]
MSDDIKSYHIFMFPFKWSVSSNKEITFDEKTDIKKVIELMKKSDWSYKYTNYKTLNSEEYNEYVYFYDNVRNAMFSEMPEHSNDSKKQCVFNYEYNQWNNPKYTIRVKQKSKEDLEYKLDIDSIKLKLYEAGIGILSFQLSNTEYSEFEDILKINEYGRRIYPQYVGNIGKKCDILPTKSSFLANSIKLECSDNTIEENFNGSIKNGFADPYYISQTITKILGDNFKAENPEDKNSDGKITFKKLIDDRMFTICWCKNDDRIRNLKRRSKKLETYGYSISKDWCKYIFVDGNDVSCKSHEMLPTLVENHTYNRWIDDSTLYGFSRYSFVCLTNSGWFPENIIKKHMQTIYYEMISLLLAQRVGILNFSDEVSDISALDNTSTVVEKIRNLKKNYIQFINRIYHREVTAQDQGIELYNLLSNCMGIEKNVKDLDQELDSLHQYATLMDDKKTNEKLNLLTILGAFLAVPALATGFFGMNFVDFTQGTSENVVSNTSGALFSNVLDFTVNTIFLSTSYLSVWAWIFMYTLAPLCAIGYVYIMYTKNKKECENIKKEFFIKLSEKYTTSPKLTGTILIIIAYCIFAMLISTAFSLITHIFPGIYAYSFLTGHFAFILTSLISIMSVLKIIEEIKRRID